MTTLVSLEFTIAPASASAPASAPASASAPAPAEFVPDLIFKLLEKNPMEYEYGIESLTHIIIGLIKDGKYDTSLIVNEKTAFMQACQHVSSFATMSSAKKDTIIAHVKEIIHHLLRYSESYGARELYVSPSRMSALRYLIHDDVVDILGDVLERDADAEFDLLKGTDNIFFTRMLQNDSVKCVECVLDYVASAPIKLTGVLEHVFSGLDVKQIRSEEMAMVFLKRSDIYAELCKTQGTVVHWLNMLLSKSYNKALKSSVLYLKNSSICYVIADNIANEYRDAFEKMVIEVYGPPPAPPAPAPAPAPLTDEIPPLTLDAPVPVPAPSPVLTEAMTAFEQRVNKEVERRFNEYVAKKKQEFAEVVKAQFAERLRNLGCDQEEINRCVANVFIV